MANRDYGHGYRDEQHDRDYGSGRYERGGFGSRDWDDDRGGFAGSGEWHARRNSEWPDQGQRGSMRERDEQDWSYSRQRGREGDTYSGRQRRDWDDGEWRHGGTPAWREGSRRPRGAWDARESAGNDWERERNERSGHGAYGRYGPGYGDSIPGGGYGRFGAGYGGYETGGWSAFGPSTGFGYGPARDYIGPDMERGESGSRNYAGRGPRGYRRSDERLKEEINEALTRHPHLDASDVEVRVEGAEVVLSGVVEDRRAKRLAEDIVEDVWGVHDIRNELKVRHGFLASLTGEKADERDVTRPPVRDTSTDTSRRSGRTSASGTTQSNP